MKKSEKFQKIIRKRHFESKLGMTKLRTQKTFTDIGIKNAETSQTKQKKKRDEKRLKCYLN